MGWQSDTEEHHESASGTSCSDSWTTPRFSCWANSKREFSQSPREVEPVEPAWKSCILLTRLTSTRFSSPETWGLFPFSTRKPVVRFYCKFWFFCAVEENFPQGLFLQDAVEGGIALITKKHWIPDARNNHDCICSFYTFFVCLCIFFGEFGTCGIVSRIGPKVNSLLWIYSWRAVADITGMEMLTQLLVLVCTTHSSALDVTMLWEVIHWLYTGYTVVSEEVT